MRLGNSDLPMHSPISSLNLAQIILLNPVFDSGKPGFAIHEAQLPKQVAFRLSTRRRRGLARKYHFAKIVGVSQSLRNVHKSSQSCLPRAITALDGCGEKCRNHLIQKF